MSLSLRWLALEVKYLDRALSFYQRHLDLPVVRKTDTEVVLTTGETEIVLRRPSGVPRGGLHTHYAFSTPAHEYSGWWDRLSQYFNLTEFEFGEAKSLYFYDTEGNCVEIGQATDPNTESESESKSDDEGMIEGESNVSERAITGVFEIVLEVESLDRAESFYTSLGFTVVDRGSDRQRIRLTTGSFDLELWEPQLGIADARGGVHVDLGLSTGDQTPEELLNQIDRPASVERLDTGIRVTDSDGHYVTLV